MHYSDTFILKNPHTQRIGSEIMNSFPHFHKHYSRNYSTNLRIDVLRILIRV